MEKGGKIFVAGNSGIIRPALLTKLTESGYKNVISRFQSDFVLTNQEDVYDFFYKEKPEYVFLIASKVAGIMGKNSHPAEFIYNNLMSECNVIRAAYKHNVKKLIFIADSCVYPNNLPQPIKEEYILKGELESTDEAYAIAEIAGIDLCKVHRKQYGCNFISAIPPNVYGPNENFEKDTAHVIPALIKKFYDAKNSDSKYVEIWGTGEARREFIFVKDLADAAIFLMNKYDGEEPINIGVGEDISIETIAMITAKIVGFKGDIVFDPTKPEGPKKKLLDSSKLEELGWKKKIAIETGIREVYDWFIART